MPAKRWSRVEGVRDDLAGTGTDANVVQLNGHDELCREVYDCAASVAQGGRAGCGLPVRRVRVVFSVNVAGSQPAGVMRTPHSTRSSLPRAAAATSRSSSGDVEGGRLGEREEAVEHRDPVELQRVRPRAPLGLRPLLGQSHTTSSSTDRSVAGSRCGTSRAVSPTASRCRRSRGDHRPAAREHLLGQRDPEGLDEIGLRLGRQHERRAPGHQRAASRRRRRRQERRSRSPAGYRGPRPHLGAAPGRYRRSTSLTRSPAATRRKPSIRSSTPFARGDPGQEQHVAVPRGRAGPARRPMALGRGRRRRRRRRRVETVDPLAALRARTWCRSGVDGLGRGDDRVPGVLARPRRSRRAPGSRQDVRGRAEPAVATHERTTLVMSEPTASATV